MHVNTTFSSFSHKKCLFFQKMLGLLQSIERHSVLVTVTPLKSLIVSDNSSAFGSSSGQKSRGLSTGDREGRFTAPTRPVRWRTEVCFRCCQTLRRRLKNIVYSDPGIDWQVLEQIFLSGYLSKTRNFERIRTAYGEKSWKVSDMHRNPTPASTIAITSNSCIRRNCFFFCTYVNWDFRIGTGSWLL